MATTTVDAPTSEREAPEAAEQPEEVPPLHNGDRLTRKEFERRYDAMPPGVEAELIEGVVYMVASVRIQSHSEPHFLITTWLGHYAVATPGVRGGDNATARFDPDNEPQPDAALFIDPACGGQARISDDDYLEGAPELAVEVAASSAAYDLHDKKRAYRRNGVQEYLVWRTRDEALDWFVLEDERYVRLTPGDDGLIESRVFPGLCLEAEALLGGDGAAVLDAVRAGTDTEAHADFTRTLDEQRDEKA